MWSSGRRASETMTCHTVVLSDISAKTAASVIVSGGTEGAMITQIEDLPPGVVGFEVRGTLHAADYRDVVLPAVERAGEVGEIRFLIVIPDFKGMSGGAVWEDLKIGLQHLRSWRRIALVTDIAVSYTHLDVYKRQMPRSWANIGSTTWSTGRLSTSA